MCTKRFATSSWVWPIPDLHVSHDKDSRRASLNTATQINIYSIFLMTKSSIMTKSSAQLGIAAAALLCSFPTSIGT